MYCKEKYLPKIHFKKEEEMTSLATGFKKDVTKPGDGKTFPKKGELARVHYTGKLTNGKQFDSSVGGPPFEFHVGMGEVIKAWDKGVAAMSKGEKAIITAAADHAYGSKGYPGVIPPNATLIFEVELLDIIPEKK